METYPWPRIGDWSSPDELGSLQKQALGKTLAIARQAPFYRQRLSEGMAFSDIPFTRKEDIREGYPFAFLAVSRHEVATYHESSGTTGQPIASFLTAADWQECIDRFTRGAAGLHRDDWVLVKTPYAMATTAHQMHNAASARGATVVPADNRTSMMSYPRVLHLLSRLDISVTWSLPSEPLFWAAAAWASGLEPRVVAPSLRALVVAGEPIGPAKRKRIGEIWGAPVVEDYGSTETTSLAGECEAGVLHPWADRFLMELYDPRTGTVVERGLGQLVVTTLYREAMPLVRYNLEDVVEIWDEPCACGWALPRIRIAGRSPVSARGRADLSQTALDELIYGLPAAFRALFWRGVIIGDQLSLEIEADPSALGDCEALLRRELKRALGLSAEVHAVPHGALVSREFLLRETAFVKPRFLFSSLDEWDRGLIYQ
ncbi:MAG: AMP-binding protein [Pseudomonadota bacterium]